MDNSVSKLEFYFCSVDWRNLLAAALSTQDTSNVLPAHGSGDCQDIWQERQILINNKSNKVLHFSIFLYSYYKRGGIRIQHES